MGYLQKYVFSLFCAALVCGILSDLSGKSFFQKQMKLACCIFLAASLLKPLISWHIADSLALEDFHKYADAAVQRGDEIRIRSVAGIIKQEAEAYILKEASSIGAEIEVAIELDYHDPPIPAAATITGRFDASTETILSGILSEKIGIPKEQQTWIRREPHDSSSWQANMPMLP